ncbi:hypothetical protein M404DRAFT_1009363, partial [Pisolithus tinctorius Marx 270]
WIQHIPLRSSSSTTIFRCSGDPDDCMACTDDTFGKVLCQIIIHSTFKSYPNVAFVDLKLLAEGVARKSKCTGSRVVNLRLRDPSLQNV